jgi:hypothetical protein
MKRIAAELTVAVPAELCSHSVQAALGDARLLDAIRALRDGKEYAGWVTSAEPGRRVEIAFAALDPGSGRRTHALGWRVVYDLAPADGGRTRVRVTVQYGRLAAVAAGGTLRAQAENDIAHRLFALHALELGLAHRDAGDPADG